MTSTDQSYDTASSMQQAVVMQHNSEQVQHSVSENITSASPQQPEQPSSSLTQKSTSMPNLKTFAALFMIITTHVSMGVSPVLVRYMQTVSGLPSFSINAFANGVTILVYSPFFFYGLYTSYYTYYYGPNGVAIVQTTEGTEKKSGKEQQSQFEDESTHTFTNTITHTIVELKDMNHTEHGNDTTDNQSCKLQQIHSPTDDDDDSVKPTTHGAHTEQVHNLQTHSKELVTPLIIQDSVALSLHTGNNSSPRSIVSSASTLASSSASSTFSSFSSSLYYLVSYYYYYFSYKHSSLTNSSSFAKFLHYGATILVTGLVITVFVICRVGKSIANLLATKYTAAINTQLVALTGPFLVTLMTLSFSFGTRLCTGGCSSNSSSKDAVEVITTEEEEEHTDDSPIKNSSASKNSAEEAPKAAPRSSYQTPIPFNFKMGISMVVTTVGATLIVLGKFSSDPYYFTWTIDFGKLFNFSKGGYNISDVISNVVGVTISFVGNVLGALYTIMLVAMSNSNTPPPAAEEKKRTEKETTAVSSVSEFIARHNKFQLSWFRLIYFQAWVVFLSCVILSIMAGENWRQSFFNLNTNGWIAISMYSLFIYVMCEVFNILGTQMLGSITSSALLPVSLLATIIFATILLNEWVNNLWQIIGCFVVIVGVTTFLVFRGLLAKHQEEERQKWLQQVQQ